MSRDASLKAMNDKTTIESKVAATILERNITFEIDGEKYEIAPPSLATLILVSEIISTLPTFENLIYRA